MANYRYDPMMCMNVPVKGTRAQDAKEGKPITSSSQLKQGKTYWCWWLSRILIYKGKNSITKKYAFEDFGGVPKNFTEEEVKKLTTYDAEPTELMNQGECPEGMTCDATDALTWNVAITIDYEDPDGEKGRKVAYGPISNVFTQAQKLVDTLQGHDCTIMAAKFGR